MIRNYLKIAIRNLLKNKSFSFINIFGLFLGTACCLYILLYVSDQYGYDTHHADAASLYRITTEINGKDGKWESVTASPPIAPAMQRDFAEVRAATRLVSFGDAGTPLLKVTGTNDTFYEPKGYYVDSSFFQVFTYTFLEGSPKTCLQEPYTVVLSSAVAQKLFGSKSPVNQSIDIANNFGSATFKVTGVFDEHVAKSHLRPHFLMSMNSGGIGEYVRTNNQWAGQNFVHSYVRLYPTAHAKALEAKLPAFLQKYGSANLKELAMQKTLHLQAVTDIHLYSKGNNEVEAVSDAKFLYFLLLIAGFIQVIACINFVNLTTARSLKRAKEIGIRKVSGANKQVLIGQFLGESLLVSLLASLLAIPAVQMALPFLNSLVGSSLTFNLVKNPTILLITLGLALLTGVLAGIYPAFYLSGFQPVSILKGVFRLSPSSANLRKGLVVFQFSIAITLIIGVVIISRQMQYIQSKDLGFDHRQKVIIKFGNSASRQQIASVKSEILRMSEVKAAAATKYYPGKNILQDFSVYTQGNDMNHSKLMRINHADEDYFKAMGIKLLAGRNFVQTDTTGNVILNEKALRVLGLTKDNALGAKLYSQFDGQINTMTIIGIVKDHHFASLKKDIQPLMTFYDVPQQLNYLVAEVQTADYKTFFQKIEDKWRKLVPSVPFEYAFMDDDLQQQYEAENTLVKILNTFMVITILISCLGLFGLATFTAESKIKEISIRKVLGASTGQLVWLQSTHFLVLVFISLLIASPLAYYGMNRWLQDFAYRIRIEWWMFALAGLVAIAIAFLTIGFQSFRAAARNPVKSLKAE